MKRISQIFLFLLLLAVLSGGGWYLFREFLPGGRKPSPLPVPELAQPPEPVDLPSPTLATEGVQEEKGVLAKLVDMERTVKSKRSGELAWKSAEKKMPLFEDDAIRTFDSASASLYFGPEGLLDVGENSLVIIKPLKREGLANEISLALLSGDFLDGLSQKSETERKTAIEAEAKKRQVTIRTVSKAGSRKGKTRIAMRNLPDRSTSLQVLSGTTQVVGAGGKEVTLDEQMVTKISDQGDILKPRRLPQAPKLLYPEQGASYTFQSKAPRVDLRWKGVDGARRYRVVVARDSSFGNLFVQERVTGTSLQLGNLKPGIYYWRVRALDADSFEGPYSSTRSLKAIHDDEPPQLAILEPPEMFVSPASTVELKGKTDRGSRVKINGQKVEVASDGSFRHTLQLKEGINLVTIEATDPAGNTQYGKRLVTYRGAKRSTAAASQDS